jgi:hypothetical protein
MSTIFVGKWDRFAADLVIADKIDRVLATRRPQFLSEKNYTAADCDKGEHQCYDQAIL